MIEKGLGISIMNEISIPTRTSRDIVTLPTVPEHYIEMGIALPSIAQASPAVKKFISYAVESGICKAIFGTVRVVALIQCTLDPLRSTGLFQRLLL